MLVLGLWLVHDLHGWVVAACRRCNDLFYVCCTLRASTSCRSLSTNHRNVCVLTDYPIVQCALIGVVCVRTYVVGRVCPQISDLKQRGTCVGGISRTYAHFASMGVLRKLSKPSS